MKLKQIFMINCSEAAESCDKAQYREAGFLEKLRLSIHLHFCSSCQNYTRKNLKLSALLKKASIKTCTKKEKEQYRKKIEEHLKEKS